MMSIEKGKHSTFWLNFFKGAGILESLTKKYALIFDENRIKPDMLLDITKECIRDMGIKTMSDIIAILRHAKKVHEESKAVEFDTSKPVETSVTKSATSTATLLTKSSETVTTTNPGLASTSSLVKPAASTSTTTSPKAVVLPNKKIQSVVKSAESSKPTTSTSASSTRNRIIGREPIFKTFKVPSPTEKKTLNRPVMLIIEFLQKTGYHTLYTLKDFHFISGLEYFRICQFVFELINFRVIYVDVPNKQQDQMTKSEERKKNQDQLIDQLILATTTLKYPGRISKSALKSINAPHSWPETVTLLAWTCARVEIMLTPRSFGGNLNNVAALGGDQDMTFGDLYSEVYRRMFLKAIAVQDQNLEETKEKFRQNIMENLVLNTDESISSLRETLAQREAELTVKEAVLDSTVSILVAKVNFSTQKLRKANSKHADLINDLYKYKNSDHVKCQIEMLDKRITIEYNILHEISKRVKNQPLSLEGKKEALVEVRQVKKKFSAVLLKELAEIEETYINGQMRKIELEEDAKKEMRDFVQLKREEFMAKHNYDILPNWG